MIIDLPYRLIGAGLALAGAAGAVALWGHHREQQGEAVVQAKWDAERARQFAAAASASESARAEESRRVAAQKEIADETQRLVDRDRRDAVAAATSGDGLRQRAAAVAAGCRGAAVNPAAAAASSSAADPGALLTDVLSRLVVRAGELAVVADQRGAAGSACERAYGALTH